MPINAKRGADFVPAPEGIFPAVCVDAIDLGLVNGQWGTRHKVRFVWEIDAKREDGSPFQVRKTYTLSLHEKATLRKDLRGWRGRDFTAEELEGFDLERVIGACCTLIVTHEEKEGTVYANATAVTKPTRTIAPSGKYTRQARQPEAREPESEPAYSESPECPVPF